MNCPACHREITGMPPVLMVIDANNAGWYYESAHCASCLHAFAWELKQTPHPHGVQDSALEVEE